MIVTLIGGAIIGAVIVLAPMLFIRKRRKRSSSEGESSAPIVKEIVEQPTPFPKMSMEAAPEEVYDLSEAISKAVGRAISANSPDLELTLDFPDRCKLFGESVASKGTVSIHKRSSDETDEAIRVVGRRVGEIESALDERLKRIEAALDVREAPKAADAGPNEREPDAEVAPLL